MSVRDQARAAREASRRVATIPEPARNRALYRMADLLSERADEVLQANRLDTDRAAAEGLAAPLAKRLVITERKLAAMQESLRGVASQRDPIGDVIVRRELDDRLILEQRRVPIGVLGIIFESRPDALVQIASLAVKSGNSVILKGGREAAESNRVLFDLFVQVTREADERFADALQLVQTRDEIAALLELDDLVDLIIPRGSAELVRHIQHNTRIPVLGHADGVCHLYIDRDADPEMAERVAVDAKCQYPAVCNAIETLLVHEAVAPSLLPRLAAAMPEVELRGDPASQKIVQLASATEEDWSTEYNDLMLSVRVVDDLETAVEHINRYGSRHTEAIVTADAASAERFMNEVDASSVLWNASTRFADGFRYGLGAEVGISTGKIHARGPVGLEGLTTTKYVVVGAGHIVADYADGSRRFTHRDVPLEERP